MTGPSKSGRSEARGHGLGELRLRSGLCECDGRHRSSRVLDVPPIVGLTLAIHCGKPCPGSSGA